MVIDVVNQRWYIYIKYILLVTVYALEDDDIPVYSLAETPESAGMLKYFAQICLQILTSYLQIYDVQRKATVD